MAYQAATVMAEELEWGTAGKSDQASMNAIFIRIVDIGDPLLT